MPSSQTPSGCTVIPLYCAVEVRLSVLKVTPSTENPCGSWLVGAAPPTSVVRRAESAQSSAPDARSSRSTSQPQVCGSSGTGSVLIVVPSLLPVQNQPPAGSYILSTKSRCVRRPARPSARSRVAWRSIVKKPSTSMLCSVDQALTFSFAPFTPNW